MESVQRKKLEDTNLEEEKSWIGKEKSNFIGEEKSDHNSN